MKPELERNEQHNVLIPKFLRAELQRLHYEHQRKTGRRGLRGPHKPDQERPADADALRAVQG